MNWREKTFVETDRNEIGADYQVFLSAEQWVLVRVVEALSGWYSADSLGFMRSTVGGLLCPYYIKKVFVKADIKSGNVVSTTMLGEISEMEKGLVQYDFFGSRSWSGGDKPLVEYLVDDLVHNLVSG